MNPRRISVLLAGLFALALFSAPATTGEVLVSEDFDHMKLDDLLPGWSRAEPSLLSIVDEPGHAKVLKISNSGERYPFLMFNLDVAKVAGKTLTMSIAAKFPGTYVPINDKLWAAPKLLMECKDANDKLLTPDAALVPQANKAEWQELKNAFAVPANAVSANVQICIQYVACEVYFDNLTIQIADAPAPPTPPAPTADATKTTPPVPAAPVVDADTPAAMAAKAPKKSIDDGGMTFGPDYAANLQKTYPSKTVNAGTVLFVGPGIGEKDPPLKIQRAWRALPSSPKQIGTQATPRTLLATLPDVLVKEKPEVVFIASDAAPGRKATTTEAEDWLDLAQLCKRYGALPVLVSRGSAGKDAKDEQFEQILQALKKAETLGSLLTLSPIPQEMFGKRASTMLTLLDTHVFLRVKADAAGKPAAKPVEE